MRTDLLGRPEPEPGTVWKHNDDRTWWMVVGCTRHRWGDKYRAVVYQRVIPCRGESCPLCRWGRNTKLKAWPRPEGWHHWGTGTLRNGPTVYAFLNFHHQVYP